MADNNLALKEYGVGQVSNTELQDELAVQVRREYQRAKQHKDSTGITAKLLRNLRAKLMEYAPEDKELVKDADVYIGLASLKQRAAMSWLIDIIVNNIEKPWTLQATPEPDLPERLKLEIVDQLMLELPTMRSMDALRDRAAQLKSAVQNLASKKAEQTTMRMETRIADQLVDADWTNVFAQFVDQLTTYPSAILRGPVAVGEPKASWRGNKLEVKRSSTLKVRTISPFDAYPAPDATTTQNGSYFIERVDYNPSELHSLIGVKGFNDANIRTVLDAYENGLQSDDLNRSAIDDLQGKESGFNKGLTIETIIYNGKIQGRFLAKHGVLVEDLQKYYECEVWVVGDYTIRAILNPNPLGKRPLYSTSYSKVDGKFWGQSVICLVFDTERICNAACRAMVRNMAYASGPIGEADSDRLEGEDITDLRPYKIFRVGPDLTGTGAPAMRFHNITSIGSDLMAVFNQFMKVADDLSGVPAYVLGSPQVAGAGRTLGGLSMLMGNAAKGIKNVQLNIDRDIITGVVEAFYYYNMLTSDDIGIKADAKVVARGATGLLQRELSQSRTVEILQLLTPYVAQGLVDKTAIQYILREIFKNTGMDVDKFIPDPYSNEKMSEILSILGNGQADAMEAGTSTPPQLPPQSMPPNMMPQIAPPYPMPVNLAQGA